MSDDLGARLHELWDDERCVWHIDFENAYDNEWPYTVVLEWTQEHDNDHHADWITFTWLFTGATVEEALTEAVSWCEALVPFRRCGACDGRGWWGRADAPVSCDDCAGSGLAA